MKDLRREWGMADKVVEKLAQRLQLTEEEIVAFLQWGTRYGKERVIPPVRPANRPKD